MTKNTGHKTLLFYQQKHGQEQERVSTKLLIMVISG